MERELLETLRRDNELRNTRNREWIGGLYFLIAFAMMFISFAVSALTAYVLPLRRFSHAFGFLAKQKVVTALYSIMWTGLYFLISATAGMSGWFVFSLFMGLWSIILLLVVLIRKLRHKGDEDEKKKGEDEDDEEAPKPATSFAPEAEQETGTRRIRGLNKWACCPDQLSKGQKRWALGTFALSVIAVLIIVIVVYSWSVLEYHVIHQGASEVEFQPGIAAKALQFMYAFPELATDFQLQMYVKIFTEYCGTTHTKKLKDSEKESKIKVAWIDKYSINMTEYIYPDYKNYSTVNEWFIRAIKPSVRPLPVAPERIVSPADSRLLIYESELTSRIWLKGYSLNYNDLLDDIEAPGLTRSYFDQGALVIARLAPQDYHRFHSPVSGTIVAIKQVSGTYWSVSSDAARSGNNAFLNTRTIVIIDAGSQVGFVAYIGVGATCVGSVILESADGRKLTVGSAITRGEQLGSMNFGGSTVLMLFAHGQIIFSPTFIQRSRYAVETRVDMGNEIGSARPL